jgi:dihydrofolate synthase/folylpolyglutamate synthase
MILDRLLDLEKTPLALRYNDREYDLEGFRRWLGEMGSPQDGQWFVHIAGTKGKGSTGALVEGLLRGLGFPTAFYSSPHLRHFGERYRYDGIPWTFEQFESALERLVDSLPAEQRRGLDEPHRFRTAFEFLTLLALVEFGERGRRLRHASPHGLPQVVVWETGLGGRLDCTNVVDPVASVITALGLDHTAVLGKEIEQIAAEKAGIIKKGRPVFVARQPEEFHDRVCPILQRRADEVGAALVYAWQLNPVLDYRPLPDGQMVRLRLPDGTEAETFLPLAGTFQRHNLEAAVAAAWYVARQAGVRVSGERFLNGLASVRWPGRLEFHLPLTPNPSPSGGEGATSEGQVLVLDGAHCPLSARTVVRSLREWQDSIPLPCRPPYEVLWGMQKDKEHAAFLAGLGEGAERDFFGTIHTYPVPGPRGGDPQALAAVAAAAGWPSRPHPSAAAALAAALATGHSVLAVGTLYTIATLSEAWGACQVCNFGARIV